MGEPQQKAERKGWKAAQTRQKLLESGIKLFAELGYAGSSTRQIEAVAGVQRNLITYHFGTKDVFWKACMAHLFQRFIDSSLPGFRDSRNMEPPERLRYLIRHFIRSSGEHPEIHRIMVDEGKRDDWRLKWIVDTYIKNFYSATMSIYEEAKQLGVARDIGPVGFYYILVGSSGLFAMAPECRQLTGEDPTTDAVIDTHAEAVAKLLIREAPDAED